MSFHGCAGAAVIALLFAAAPAAPVEHDDNQRSVTAAADAAQLDPRTAEVAQRLWKDVVCLCARCQRLTLSACHCPDAAGERKKLVDLLRGRDVSSPTALEASYQAVLKEYVTRTGNRHVLASDHPTGLSDDVMAVAGAVGIVAAACVAVIVVETRRRARRPSRGRGRR